MKQILTEWRKFITENSKKIGTLNSDYAGYVELYSPYSQNREQAQVGAPGDQVEILGSWSDKGVKWLEVDINGTKGWIDSGELDLPGLSEEDNLEQNIYSFDYDETLIRHKPDPEDPEFGIVYDGLHEENIAKLRELAAAGNKVLIVTSRSKRTGDKHPWDTAPDPEELVAELGLPVESVHYTHGNFKVETLLSLGVVEHWDDDEEEVAAAEAVGIKANLVPSVLPEGAIAKWWANKLHENGNEVSPRMKKYLKNHPYMEPDSLQQTN